MKQRLTGEESKLETTISYILIVGLVLSILLEVAGMIMYLRENGNLLISTDASVFLHGDNFFYLIYELEAGKYTNIPAIALMTYGLVVLILIPFIRVLASVILFGWEKNVKYVWITLFVLVVITVSMALH
jgi:uncharacterized membrane protein